MNKAYKWWKMISFHIQSSKWIWKSCNHTKLRVKRILSNHDIEVRSNRNLGHFTLHPVQHLFPQAPVAFSHTSLFNTYLLARKLVVFWNLSWSWLCNQCLSPLYEVYSIQHYVIKLSVTCDRSVVFSGYSGFLHQ